MIRMRKLLSIFGVIMLLFIPSNGNAHTPSEYATYLKSNAVDATEYVLDKLRNYQVVAIGEDHWIADHTPFFCKILKEAAKNKETRPNVVALEFGSELDQETAQNVALSATFEPDSVIKILQHAPDILGNPYKEYFDVFKCVWEVNQTLPKEERISIRLLDPAGVQDSFNQTPMQRGRDRDMSMYNKLRFDFVRGNKIIFYAGQAHTQHQIRGYKQRGREYYYNYPSAGFLIKASYPKDVFTIDLWAPLNMGAGYKENPETGNWYEKNNGMYDQAFQEYGNKPCGFDITEGPWSEITMMNYFCTPGKEDDWYPEIVTDASPYTREVRLSSLVDGIVFVKPSKDFTGGHLIDIYTPEFIEICKQRSNGELDSADKILRQVNEWHPLMSMPK